MPWSFRMIPKIKIMRYLKFWCPDYVIGFLKISFLFLPPSSESGINSWCIPTNNPPVFWSNKHPWPQKAPLEAALASRKVSLPSPWPCSCGLKKQRWTLKQCQIYSPVGHLRNVVFWTQNVSKIDKHVVVESVILITWQLSGAVTSNFVGWVYIRKKYMGSKFSTVSASSQHALHFATWHLLKPLKNQRTSCINLLSQAKQVESFCIS